MSLLFLFFHSLTRMGSDFFHFLNGPNLPLPLLKFYGESDVYGIFPDLISCCFSPFFIFRKKDTKRESNLATLFVHPSKTNQIYGTLGREVVFLFLSLPLSNKREKPSLFLQGRSRDLQKWARLFFMREYSLRN